MLRAFFQKRELLIGAAADAWLQCMVVLPELGSGAMLLKPRFSKAAERDRFSHRPLRGRLPFETGCGEVGLDAGANGLEDGLDPIWAILLE